MKPRSQSALGSAIASASIAVASTIIGLGFGAMVSMTYSAPKSDQSWLSRLLGQSISGAWPVLEFPTAHSDFWPSILVLTVLAIAIVYYEFRYRIIPLAITVPGAIIGLGLAAKLPHVSLTNSVAGLIFGCVGLSILNLAYSRTEGREGQTGIGGGLIMMQGMLGTYLGLPASVLAFGMASVSATTYGLAAERLLGREVSQIEMGPWLALFALTCAYARLSQTMAAI